MAHTRIKICGIRDARALDWAVDAGADAVGFVFVRSSPRHIEPAEAWALVGALPPFVTSVGLLANASVETFCEIEQDCPTSLVQLHGNESVSVVRQCGPGVVKAIRFDAETIAAELSRWDGVEEVDAILVDGSAGGEGRTLDWSCLAEHVAGVSKPIILAGGLTPENVSEAIRTVRPYAVDVSSGVEKERGVKDRARIAAFCRAVREADRG